MSHIFNIENMDAFNEKINIDDLYEKKKNYDLSKLEIFNKLLNRAHVKIKTTSRQKIDCQYCWFTVPEVMIGVPKYDQGSCISYIMDKLNTNGFMVKYLHPSVILISWKHWVPSYVRNEIKKKTGVEVDSYGNIINNEAETRWSMNCRFKGLFTPYKDKRIGEYYEPIIIKPATRRGINYKFPK